MNGSAASITSVTSREMTSTPTVFGRRSVRWFTTPNTAERVSKIAKKSKGVIALNFVGKRDQATNPDTSGSSPLQSPVAADGYHAWIGLRGSFAIDWFTPCGGRSARRTRYGSNCGPTDLKKGPFVSSGALNLYLVSLAFS